MLCFLRFILGSLDKLSPQTADSLAASWFPVEPSYCFLLQRDGRAGLRSWRPPCCLQRRSCRMRSVLQASLSQNCPFILNNCSMYKKCCKKQHEIFEMLFFYSTFFLCRLASGRHYQGGEGQDWSCGFCRTRNPASRGERPPASPSRPFQSQGEQPAFVYTKQTHREESGHPQPVLFHWALRRYQDAWWKTGEIAIQSAL